jgi:hypothetical protein
MTGRERRWLTELIRQAGGRANSLDSLVSMLDRPEWRWLPGRLRMLSAIFVGLFILGYLGLGFFVLVSVSSLLNLY